MSNRFTPKFTITELSVVSDCMEIQWILLQALKTVSTMED